MPTWRWGRRQRASERLRGPSSPAIPQAFFPAGVRVRSPVAPLGAVAFRLQGGEMGADLSGVVVHQFGGGAAPFRGGTGRGHVAPAHAAQQAEELLGERSEEHTSELQSREK